MDVMRGLGIEILLDNNDSFLKIKETLTPELEFPSKKDKILYQSCHLLHKKGKYYIVHFKEMFKLDGKDSTINDTDIARRNTIVGLLEDWELLTIVHPEIIEENCLPINLIKILSFKGKERLTINFKIYSWDIQ